MKPVIHRGSLSALLILLIAIAGCSVRSFDGTAISDNNSFRLDYSLLDRREEAFITMVAGDTLQVSVAQDAGCVDMTVGIDGQEPIYQGNGLTDMEFTLNISEFGSYHITVTGHDACGSVVCQTH